MNHHASKEKTVLVEPLKEAPEEIQKKKEVEWQQSPSPISPDAFQHHCDTVLRDCLRDARNQILTLEDLTSAFRSRVLYHAAKQQSRASSPSLVRVDGPCRVEEEEEEEEHDRGSSGGDGSSRTKGWSGGVQRSRPTSCDSFLSFSSSSSSPLARRSEEGGKKSRATPLKDQCMEDIMQRCVYIQQRRSVLVKHLHQLSETLWKEKKKQRSSMPTPASEGDGRAGFGVSPVNVNSSFVSSFHMQRKANENDEEKENLQRRAWVEEQEHQRCIAQKERIRQVKVALGMPVEWEPSFHSSTNAVVSPEDRAHETEACTGERSALSSFSPPPTRHEWKVEEEEEKEEEEQQQSSPHGRVATPPPSSCPNRRPEDFFCCCPIPCRVSLASGTSPPLSNVTDVEKEEEEEEEAARRRHMRNASTPEKEEKEENRLGTLSPSYRAITSTSHHARTTVEAEVASQSATMHLAAYFIHFASEEERIAHLILPLSPTQHTFDAFYTEAIEKRALHRKGLAAHTLDRTHPSAAARVDSSALPDRTEGVEAGLSLLWEMMQDDLLPPPQGRRRRQERRTPPPSSAVVHTLSSSSSDDEKEKEEEDEVMVVEEERKRGMDRVRHRRSHEKGGGGAAVLPQDDDEKDDARRPPCVVLPLVQSLWEYACAAPWWSDDDEDDEEDEAEDKKNPQHKKNRRAASDAEASRLQGSGGERGGQEKKGPPHFLLHEETMTENTKEKEKDDAEADERKGREKGVLYRMHRMRETQRVPLGAAIPPHVSLGSHYVVPMAFLPTEESTVFVGSGVDPPPPRRASSSSSSSSPPLLTAATVAVQRMMAALCRQGRHGMTREEEKNEKKNYTWGESNGGDRVDGFYGRGAAREGHTSHSRRQGRGGGGASISSSSSSSRIAAVCASSQEVKSLRETALLESIARVVAHRWTFIDDPCMEEGLKADDARGNKKVPTPKGNTTESGRRAWEGWGNGNPIPRPAGHSSEPFFLSSAVPPLRLPPEHNALSSHGSSSSTLPPAEDPKKTVEEMECIESFLQLLSIRLVVEIMTRVLLYQDALRHMHEGETQLLVGTPVQRACLLTCDSLVPPPSLSSSSGGVPPGGCGEGSTPTDVHSPATNENERQDTTSPSSSVRVHWEKSLSPTPVPAVGEHRIGGGHTALPVLPFAPTAFLPMLLLTLPEVPQIFYGLAYAFSVCLESDVALGSPWCSSSCAQQALCSLPSRSPGGFSFLLPSSSSAAAFSSSSSSSCKAVKTLPHPQGEKDGKKLLTSTCPTVVARVLRAISFNTPALLPLIRLWLYLWAYVFADTTPGEEGEESEKAFTTKTTTTVALPETHASSHFLPVSIATSMFWWEQMVFPAVRQRAMEAALLLRSPPLLCGTSHGCRLPHPAAASAVAVPPLSMISPSASTVSSLRAEEENVHGNKMPDRVQVAHASYSMATPAYDLLCASDHRFLKRLVQEVKAVVLSREEKYKG